MDIVGGGFGFFALISLLYTVIMIGALVVVVIALWRGMRALETIATLLARIEHRFPDDRG
jgi:uncharacterized membrane protein